MSANPAFERQQAMMAITLYEQELRAAGALDEEIPMLTHLREQLAAGHIQPAEVYDKLRQLRETRQDYH